MSIDTRDAVATLTKDDVWGEDVTYARIDWQHEVAEGNTNRGYWEWVLIQIEAAKTNAAQAKPQS